MGNNWSRLGTYRVRKSTLLVVGGMTVHRADDDVSLRCRFSEKSISAPRNVTKRSGRGSDLLKGEKESGVKLLQLFGLSHLKVK